MNQFTMFVWMPLWKQMRWHLLLLVLGLAFISTNLWMESRHLSGEDTEAMQGLPPTSAPVTHHGNMGSVGSVGSGRPTLSDSAYSMAERNRVPPASGLMGGARDRFSAGALSGIPETLPVNAAGYPTERTSPGLGQAGGGALSGTPRGTRSLGSSMVSPPAIPALAPSAVTDMNSGVGIATQASYKVLNNGAVTESVGGAGSPAETPVSSVSSTSSTSSSSSTAAEGSTDPASQNGGAGTATFVPQATAEDLYRSKYGWSTYGEMVRRKMIDQYNVTVPTEAGSPSMDSISPSSGE